MTIFETTENSCSLFLERRRWKQRGMKKKDFLNKFTRWSQGTSLVKIPKIAQSPKRNKRETLVHFGLIWNKTCVYQLTWLWEPIDERNERKKRLEVKQANSWKSQVSETVIEIRLSFSCCDIHVDVNRQKQRGKECLWLKNPLWINQVQLSQKVEN